MLINTNLLIQGSHLPATFKGTPDDLFVAMLERMKIVSPSGQSFFVVGDTEPSSNLGPWLKGGTQWWVFDAELKRYVPLDISASETIWFQTSVTTPVTQDPPVWLQIAADGNPVAWNWWNGAVWVDFTSLKDRSVTQEKLFYTANFFGTASGTDNYSITFEPNTSFTYGDGVTRAFAAYIKFPNANTGAVKLAVNGDAGGGVPVKKNVNQDLVAGEILAGSVHLLVFDGVNFQIQTPLVTPGPPLPIVPGGIIAFSDGLVIQNNAGSPTTTVDITAQRVILSTTNGAIFSTFSVSESIDITVPGLGGLDTTTTPEAASTWYYVWIVSNGSDVSAVFSTSSTSPTLPADYVYTALLGAVFNDAASDLLLFHQTDRRTSIVAIDISTTMAAPELLAFPDIVPPIAKTVFGVLRSGIGQLSQNQQATIAGDSAGIGLLTVHISSDGAGAPIESGFFDVSMITPQSVYLDNYAFAATLSVAGFTL